MKTTQVLFIVLFIGLIVWIVTSAHLLDVKNKSEGFMDDTISSEPEIASGVMPTRLNVQAMPNASIPGTLPFGPYRQTAAVGSYQYQDPSLMPAELKQMKQLNEDLRAFLVFEGASVASSSDPTVQLPLTQLRADSKNLYQEITVLERNPGVPSTLTQQQLADIQEGLTFLQRKVRLFQTAGVVSGGSEGFEDMQKPKTRATKDDLLGLQTRTYGAILTLSASGTVDPIVQARIKKLQAMYTDVTDMITKLDKGLLTAKEIPAFQEDINQILPSLDKPNKAIMDVFAQGDGTQLNPVEQQLAALVGNDQAQNVFKSLVDKGSFKIELGYGDTKYSKKMKMNADGSVGSDDTATNGALHNDTPFDSTMPGVEERCSTKDKKNTRPGGLDWMKRAESICEQTRLRGLDPLDFGCIKPNSMMSPAYSWRGHTKMICGRLAATTDPNLPTVCGCPPANWKGWSLSY
jgi:hypothetical protein